MPQGLIPSDNLVVVVLGEAVVAIVLFADAMFFQLAIRLFADRFAAVGTGCGQGLIIAVIRAAVVFGGGLAHCTAIVAEEAFSGRIAVRQTEGPDINGRAALAANEAGLFTVRRIHDLGLRFSLRFRAHDIHISGGKSSFSCRSIGNQHNSRRKAGKGFTDKGSCPFRRIENRILIHSKAPFQPTAACDSRCYRHFIPSISILLYRKNRILSTPLRGKVN